jgi:hypothetical protein
VLVLLVILFVLTESIIAGGLISMRHVIRPSSGLGVLAMLAIGLLAAAPTILAPIVWLRRLESRDSWQNAPPMERWAERAIAAREDWSSQNHMASLVHVKPGALRAVLALLALHALSLLMRVETRARHGYLVDVRTIHFANLTLLNNNSRLLFLSNFDGTWDNYLTDFTEKVRIQVTLVWNSGVGFPPTRFFVLDGVIRARLFQVWKRRAMAPTLYWFQAYPNLSVEQIWRQSRVADGLRRLALEGRKAEQWAALL